MPINVNGTVITGGTTVVATDASSNKIYEQSTAGVVNMPRTSANAALTPLFNVGMNSSSGWTDLGGVVQWTYTAGSGYTNIGSCFNTSNGRFTAPWTGLYLFRHHIYAYGPDSTYTWYFHPQYLVNGSYTTRRPGGTPYRIRCYGLYANYQQDSDCCELIYLTAGDYVEVYAPRSGTMQGYGPYNTFNGAYLGN
jgi:hypothetical protein